MNEKVLVLGHRGYRKMFPENTLLAFSKAFEFGADGIECDVQKSEDGIYYIFHDVDFQRTTGVKGEIDHEKSQRIKTLNAGEGQVIPDLDSFLDSLPHDKLINIELKEETLGVKDCYLIIDKLNERNLKNNILISSFKHNLLPPFKRAGFKTGMIFETETERLKENPIRQITNIMKYRPWSINPPVNVFLNPMPLSLKLFIKTAKIMEIKFVFWTVNNEMQYNAIKDLAHAIITDDVEEMIKLRDNS